MTNTDLELTILLYHLLLNTGYHEKTKIIYTMEEVFEGYNSGSNQD